MEHNFVTEEGIIEKYLLHRLSERETDDFEEHLLYCKECRSLLAETKDIMALTQYMAIHTNKGETKEVNIKKSATFYRPWMKAAAVFLIIVCSAGIIRSLMQKPTESLVRNESKPNPIKKVADSANINESKLAKVLNKPLLQGNNMSLSDNYKEFALYENAIKNNLRGDNIEIISPKISSKIGYDEKVVFVLKDNSQEILLSVINNAGKTIFEDTVKIPFTLPVKLPRGLYYWEITKNDEVVFVSKFLIR